LGDDGRLKSEKTIRQMLKARGVRRGSRVITYCTGGVRSAWVAAVLVDLGYEDVRNFAGSTWQWSAGPASKYPLESD
jgi:thiosulfate/3-mercaptopyruvate sulfurtransferase